MSLFERLGTGYGTNLVATSIIVAAASGSASMLWYGLAATHWIPILVTCIAAIVWSPFMIIDLLARSRQTREASFLDAQKPYGFTGTVPPATASAAMAAGSQSRTAPELVRPATPQAGANKKSTVH